MRTALLEELAGRDATLLGQDWGGLVGLRLVAERPEHFLQEDVGPEIATVIADFVTATARG